MGCFDSHEGRSSLAQISGCPKPFQENPQNSCSPDQTVGYVQHKTGDAFGGNDAAASWNSAL